MARSWSRASAGDAERLLTAVRAGVSANAAGRALGLTKGQIAGVLRGSGLVLPRGTVIVEEHRGRVRAGFAEHGTVKAAATAAGIHESAARRILAEAGLVPARPAPKGKPAARARALELAAAGWSDKAIAAEVGVHWGTVRDWRRGKVRRSLGGRRIRLDAVAVTDPRTGTRYLEAMTDEHPDQPATSSRYLTLQEREDIADGLRAGLSLRRIAELIRKSPSTVSREIAERSYAGLYFPHRADADAREKRARPKPCKLIENTELRERVEAGLREEHSPEEISNRLRKDFPDDPSMRVSHETIYQALYFQARGGLKRELVAALRTGRACRKPQRRSDERRPRFVDPMVMISDRPAEVEDRAVPGHWEGDLIMGAGNKTAIGTLVERTTRYTMLLHLPNGHTAEQVRDQLLVAIKALPEHLRGSLTWDQGSEMARHKQITMDADMQVYFCDPASPWQRGTNENTNGLLRQYFPKGSDLSVHSLEDLEFVAQKLNRRPRKTLDWDTPGERLNALLNT